MPVVTVDDVLEAWKAKWDGGSLAAVKLYAPRKYPGENPVRYTVVRVTEESGGRELVTDGKVLQRFVVEHEIWTRESPAPTSAYQAIAEALYVGTQSNPSAGLTLPGSNRVGRSFGRGWELTTDPRLTGGADVYKLTGRFEVNTEAQDA